MGHAEQRPPTLDEFLAWESVQPERYEYVDGLITMMTGGTFAHTDIKGNLFAALRTRLRGSGCRPLIEGPKLLFDGQCLYPDVAVICGETRPQDDVMTDAVLIAEVLSPTTEARDRGRKWATYRGLPSLQHYLLIAQDAVLVEIFTREGDGWRWMRCSSPDDCLALTAVGVELPLAEVYEDIPVAAVSTTAER